MMRTGDLIFYLEFSSALFFIFYAAYTPVLNFFLRRRIFKLINKSSLAIDLDTREATQNRVLSDRRNNQIIYSILGASLGLVLTFFDPLSGWNIGMRCLIIFGFGFLGFRLPTMKEESLQKQRRSEIEEDISSVVDLFIVMLDSGATLDEALSRFLSDPHFPDRPIKQELAQLAHELTISPNRQKAFQNFADATQLDVLRLFNSVLIQSELYGTPVSKGLRGLASEMRQKQYNALEAKSSALGPKLTIPMTLFFMPLIFIIVLAPTLIRAFKLS